MCISQDTSCYLDLRDKEKIKNLSRGGKSIYIGKKIGGSMLKNDCFGVLTL